MITCLNQFLSKNILLFFQKFPSLLQLVIFAESDIRSLTMSAVQESVELMCHLQK